MSQVIVVVAVAVVLRRAPIRVDLGGKRHVIRHVVRHKSTWFQLTGGTSSAAVTSTFFGISEFSTGEFETFSVDMITGLISL